MKRYKVIVESWDSWEVIVEADSPDEAEKLALNIDMIGSNAKFLGGEVEATEVNELEDTGEETNDSGSGERTEDEGDVS